MNKKTLMYQLKDMGIKNNDKIMLHSSMKAIGSVDGGADAVVEAFAEYLCDGMFMTPTHTWKQMSEEYNLLNPETEPSCVGIITNRMLARKESYRSLHPTHSIAAIGKGARDYVSGDEAFDTPCNPLGCFGRLRDIDAKILLAGVTHAKNTYIHSIEESMDIKERFTSEKTTFRVLMPDKSIKSVPMYRHYNYQTPHISESFDKLMDYYFETGAARKVRLGEADSILCEAKKLFDVTCEVLKRKPDYFIPYKAKC